MKATLHLLIFFSLNSLVFSQPANDTCSNAENIALTTSNQTINFSINDAVLNNEVGCEGTTAQNYADVWYEFTMPVNGNLRINGQIAWNRFAVYDACGGNEITCFSANGLVESLQMGNSYLLRVFRTASLAGNTGFQSFNIVAIESPDNETCATAENIALSTSNQSIDFSISGAEINNEEGCSGTSNTDLLDVWYEFTMPVSGNIIINGQIAWNQFSIYDTCNGNEIACFSGSSVVDGMVGGDTYLLRVYRISALAFNLNFQSFDIQAFEAIDNDTCVDATNISVDTNISTVNFDIKGAEVNNEVGCEGTSSSDYLDAWYEFTMPVNGNLNINGQIAWNQFAIYDSCGGNEIACFSGSDLVEGLEAGITYQLRVFRTLNTALNSGFQSFTTQAFEVVANDDCSGAENLILYTQQQNIDFYITGAESNNEVGCEGTAPQNYVDLWYSFEMPFSGDVFINGQISWNNFAVYESCGGNEVYCSNTSALVQALDAGETYILRVFRTETNATNTGFQNFSIQAFENTTNCASISIWDGSTWSNGIPDTTTKAVINDDFDISNDIEWCELEIVNGKVSLLEDAKLTLNDAENSLYINADSELEVKGILSSVGDMQIEGNLIFKSDDTSTGQLDEFNANITGDVTVELYIPAGLPDLRRAFRFLSSAVNSTGSINANWQEGATTADVTPNPNPGFGTHITGGSIADGFDQNGSGSSSMFTFDNNFVATGAQTQSDAWTPLPDTNTKTLQAGEAYLTFIRGDRSIDVTDSTTEPTNTTLRASGDLHTGSRVFSSANNTTSPEYGMSDQQDFFSLVGNPYQAIVDVNKLTPDFSNVNPHSYWVWDPNLGTRGNYATVSLPGGSNTTSSPANQFVQPGQSFFVQTIANGPSSLMFNENDKDVDGGATAIFSDPSNPSIKLLLYTTSAYNAGERETDGLLINFNENGNNGLDLLDADKLQGPDESLARFHGNALISIEHRGTPLEDENLPLSTTGYTKDYYMFVANAINIQDNFEAYLLDNYTGIQTQLNEGFTPLHFSVDANIPESIAQERFSLIFENTALGLNENTFGSDFSLYPNPIVDGFFSIRTPNLSGEVSVEVISLLGQQVSIQKLASVGNQVNVNVTNLSKGIYVVKLTQGNQSFNSKLIIR